MSVPLLESEWDLPEGLLGRGSEVARSLMMDTLANLEYIRIIASYGKRMESTSISNVTMDTSVSFNTGQEQAHLVEECRCPQGYKGTSCEVFPIDLNYCDLVTYHEQMERNRTAPVDFIGKERIHLAYVVLVEVMLSAAPNQTVPLFVTAARASADVLATLQVRNTTD